MRPKAESTIALQKSRTNNLIVLVEFQLKLTQRTVYNDFPTHYNALQSYKYRAVLGKFAVVYARTRFFNIFKFLKSRNLKGASFSPVSNLITRLHLKFLPKPQKNYENIVFQGRPAANCTLMAHSIRVAQPIRLQHLHQYTSRILLNKQQPPFGAKIC